MRQSKFLKMMATAVLGVGCLLLSMNISLAENNLNLKKSGVETSVKSYWQSPLSFSGGQFDGTKVSASALQLDSTGLYAGFDSLGRYNGGAYYSGSYTTDVIPVAFNEAIPSWQANTPPGTWTEIEMSALVDGVWTKWYTLGAWMEGDQPFQRHSIVGQSDASGYVATDTLILDKSATAVKARVNLYTTDPAVTPTLRKFGFTFSNGTDTAGAVPSNGLTSALDVPKRSQMVFPDGGEVWCSPTSTSMVMAYWANVTGNSALNIPVPTVVQGVWDYRYDGAGNWPFNTAYASSFGLDGKVVRMSSLAEVQQWTAAGVPVIASIAYKKGALDNSPIPSTDGHLLVIRGFDAAGNVLTNDPAAASDEGVTITYNRLQFEKAWLNNSNGTTYLIYPQGWTTPVSNGHW